MLTRSHLSGWLKSPRSDVRADRSSMTTTKSSSAGHRRATSIPSLVRWWAAPSEGCGEVASVVVAAEETEVGTAEAETAVADTTVKRLNRMPRQLVFRCSTPDGSGG